LNMSIIVCIFIGISGNVTNQLYIPYGIALHPTTSTLYISDYGNHRIMSYSSGADNGTLIFGSGELGFNNIQLYNPVGLHYDAFTNSLIIANHWELLAGSPIGLTGVPPDGLYRPIDMTLDPMGNCYVADYDNQRIQFFPIGERNGTTIAGITDVRGTSATLLDRPASVKLDNQLNLYVSDRFNHRVQKFMRY